MDEQLMAPGVGGDRGCPRVVGRFDGAAGGADNRYRWRQYWENMLAARFSGKGQLNSKGTLIMYILVITETIRNYKTFWSSY